MKLRHSLSSHECPDGIFTRLGFPLRIGLCRARGLASFEFALFWVSVVLVLNEMVLVLDAGSSRRALRVRVPLTLSTSTANAEYEYR
jgi:hypothetical protein